MMDPASYPALLAPLELGQVRLRNRLVHVSTSTDSTHAGRVSGDLLTVCLAVSPELVPAGPSQ